jgi:uncharacterized protein YdhG (YjbR/CyaY superfamily)
VSAVDDYFAGLDERSRAAFERIRDLAMEVVPEAEQGTSYGMAALKLAGKPLLGFRAAKQHLSVFPFSGEIVDALGDRLRGFEVSKGTVRFDAAAPPPDDVVREMVRLRQGEIAGAR